MFFEVEKMNEVDHPLNQEARVSHYETRLSRQIKKESDIIMEVGASLPIGVVGYITALFLEKQKLVIPDTYFPFGGGNRSGLFPFGIPRDSQASEVMTDLEGKGIAGAIEWIILGSFSQDLTIQQATYLRDDRKRQLAKYGLESVMQIRKYREKLRNCLFSPHFRIVKLPPWITDSEILQLSGKE